MSPAARAPPRLAAPFTALPPPCGTAGNLTRGLYNPVTKKHYQQETGPGDVSARPKGKKGGWG